MCVLENLKNCVQKVLRKCSDKATWSDDSWSINPLVQALFRSSLSVSVVKVSNSTTLLTAIVVTFFGALSSEQPCYWTHDRHQAPSILLSSQTIV